MRVKDNTVSLVGLTTQALFAMIVAEQVAIAHGAELVITSGTEANVKHSLTSLHYSGNAFDMRTRFWQPAEIKQVRDEIAARLGIHFDVIIEKTHIHIEYQPKYQAQ